MLRHFTDDSVRPYGWNHMAEVVHAKRRTPSYIGDMPHTWVGSGYISAVRTLFVYEQEDQLVLAAGIDPAWLDEGVKILGLPTQYGTISYQMREQDDDILFSANGHAAPPGGFKLALPPELTDRSIEVNGNAAVVREGSVSFRKLPIQIRIFRPPPEAQAEAKTDAPPEEI